MTTIKTEINLYKFNELEKKAQEKAIFEHRQFMLETLCFDDFDGTDEQKEYAYNEMYADIEEDDNLVIDNIIANEYLYFIDGTLAHVTTFTGNHKKAGSTEFYFLGKTYTITQEA